jgi:hypothetical protein
MKKCGTIADSTSVVANFGKLILDVQVSQEPTNLETRSALHTIEALDELHAGFGSQLLGLRKKPSIAAPRVFNHEPGPRIRATIGNHNGALKHLVSEIYPLCSSRVSPGSLSGNSSERRLRGALGTPGIAVSRALERVLQSGANNFTAENLAAN